MLAVRNALAIRSAQERAVLVPPAHVRDLLGPRPERGSSDRQQWDQLTCDVERFRLEHKLDVERDGALGLRREGHGGSPAQRGFHPGDARARDALAGRVRAWREERNLGPAREELGLELQLPDHGLER